MSPGGRDSRPRVRADVALALLEVIQQQDVPLEVLEDEDVSQTLPRRLGLSGVVDRQVQLHRENARKGRRITDSELAELIKLVLRRPDAVEVFFEVGVRLAGPPARGMVRSLPRGLKLFVAKRRALKRLRTLFGRRLGGFVPGQFVLEGSASPFVQADPDGKACQIVSGLCQGILRDLLSHKILVVEQACETRGDPSCRWALVPSSLEEAG